MLTFSGAQSLYGQLTNDASTANLSFGATMTNEAIRYMLGNIPWPFMETTTTASTVAGTQSYALPGNMRRLVSVYILVGTYKYTPIEVTSFDDWNRVNNPTGVQSDNASFFFVQGNSIQFWPTPASSSNTITYEYLQSAKDISVADYTTGTIATIANGSAAVTGSGTTWTAGMVGKYIRITSTSAANTGDGLWYKISAVGSTTTLTLSTVYTGVSIAAGSANYTIGDCMLIPESYQAAPVYYAVAEYWRKQNDEARADRFQQKYEALVMQMRNEEGSKTTSVVVDDNIDYMQVNPNLNRSAT